MMVDSANRIARVSALLRSIGAATLFLLIPCTPTLAAPTVITEFFNTTLGHYVLITSAAEVAFIDAGGAGPGWQKTGKTVNANTAADDAPGLVPVCRFYGSISPGPNSHFFTADPDECSAVKTDPGWHYEGIAFYVALPADGECAAGQLQVWRAYNNGFKPQLGINDGNHRFSVDRASIRKLVDNGWNDEGVVFCAAANDPSIPFSLTVSSASLLLLPGTSRDIYVTFEPRNGFTGTASLTASGLLPGVSYEFLPGTVTVGSGPVATALRFTVAGSAPPSTSPNIVTISAQESGGRGALAGVALGIAASGDPVAVRLNAIAAVEEKSRDLRTQRPAPLAFLQAIAAFMAARPEYQAAGVNADSLTAWGRFKDGNLHLVANNLELAPPANATSGPAMLPKSGAELPAATKARLIQSFGPAFAGQTPVNQMRGYLRAKGWGVRAGPDGEAHVGTLKGVAGDGFFYLNTHGGQVDIDDPSEPFGKIFAVQSSTLVDDDYERVFAPDLQALRLVHFTAANFRVVRVLGLFPRDDVDTRYGITYRFVDKYMSFANESVVLMNACFSGRDSNFINAFIRKGVGVYLGWSELLSEAAAYPSAPYFVDRMLGVNQYPDKESPPQRAFPYDLVLQDMAKKRLDSDPNTGARLQATARPGLAYPPIFAPSIRYLRVNEFDEELALVGEFGVDQPKVTVGGNPLPLKSWSATQIVAKLPQAGAGAAGDTIVEVRGVKSNARQLTEWTVPLKYSWIQALDQPEYRFEGTGPFRFRADIAGYRMLPGETPKYATLGGMPTRDSALPITASGVHRDGDCVGTLSGSGSYVSPTALNGGAGPVLSSAFRMAGDTRQAAFGMAFGAAVSPHTLTLSGPAGCATGAFRIPPVMGLLDGRIDLPTSQLDNPMAIPLPAIQFTLDSNFGIPGKTKPTTDFGGTITVSWTPVAANTPPRDTDDAGK
ncbi:MAG: hypothetical protein ABI831_14710 [Betaproteobacteria bacterium]